jgi:hypothetical protein
MTEKENAIAMWKNENAHTHRQITVCCNCMWCSVRHRDGQFAGFVCGKMVMDLGIIDVNSNTCSVLATDICDDWESFK